MAGIGIGVGVAEADVEADVGTEAEAGTPVMLGIFSDLERELSE